MFMVRVSAYTCLVLGVGMLVLIILVPAAWWGLLVGSAAMFAAGGVLLLVYRFVKPQMPDFNDLPGLGGDEADMEEILTSTDRMMNRVSKMSSLGSAMAKNREKELRQSGHKVSVEVLAIRTPKKQASSDPVMEFRLRIQPPEGEAYEVKKHRQQVSQSIYPQITVGAVYDAFVDPRDPKTLVIDWG